MTRTFAAMTHLDEAVTGAGGVALRYSGLYGPHEDTQTKAVRKRRYPVIGDGGGITSFIDLHDATAATLLALEHDGPAIYNVTDDEPTPMREWLPALAAALGAKPPRHYPLWAGRLFMGDALAVMTQARGAANAKAKPSSAGHCATPAGGRASPRLRPSPATYASGLTSPPPTSPRLSGWWAAGP